MKRDALGPIYRTAAAVTSVLFFFAAASRKTSEFTQKGSSKDDMKRAPGEAAEGG